jgi:hypothetical protein
MIDFRKVTLGFLIAASCFGLHNNVAKADECILSLKVKTFTYYNTAECRYRYNPPVETQFSFPIADIGVKGLDPIARCINSYQLRTVIPNIITANRISTCDEPAECYSGYDAPAPQFPKAFDGNFKISYKNSRGQIIGGSYNSEHLVCPA